MTIAERAGVDALANVGVHEDPPHANWGPFIRIYLAFVGIFQPAAWCCAFVVFRIWTAAAELGVKTGFPKTGSCSALAKWAQGCGRLHAAPPSYPCVFLVRGRDRRGDYMPGLFVHTGLLLDSAGSTVEGNSNADGSAEGYEVCKRSRPPGNAYAYIEIN